MSQVTILKDGKKFPAIVESIGPPNFDGVFGNYYKVDLSVIIKEGDIELIKCGKK